MGTKRKNRFWSNDEKRSICQQTTVPDVSIAQIAQRYAVNANLIHKWLKDPQFAVQTDDADEVMEDVDFLPIEIGATSRRGQGVGSGLVARNFLGK